MRVAFFGNIANSQFRIARALQGHDDIEAHLCVDVNDVPAARPESDDPDLRSGYPDWIHEGRWLGPRNAVVPWASPVVAELREFDLVVASGSGPVYAQHSGRPWCFLVTGGDLTVRPFPLRYSSQYSSYRDRVAALVIGAHQRRAIRRADEIWAQPFAPFRDALARLRVPPSRRARSSIPMGVDIERFRPGNPAGGSSPFGDSDFVVFHPSRLMISGTTKNRATGQWKGNDRLVEGFAEFVRSGRAERPLLAMPDVSMSPDVQQVKRLVDRLGIAENVRWLSAPDVRGFTRAELASMYQAADVVADDFGVGWFGLVVLEGLACAKPVLCHVDQAAMTELYPWHPIIDVVAPADIAAALDRLHGDAGSRAELGRQGRAWVEEFHSPSAVASGCAGAVAGALARLVASPRGG